MWVGEEGRILGSVTIGGCVDARVIAESEQALSSFEPRLVEMKLADEDAWEIGFSCAGDLDVLIEPMDLTSPTSNLLDLYRAVRAAVDHGKRAVLATSLKETSHKLLVVEGGETVRNVGHRRNSIVKRKTVALELMRKRASSTVSLGPNAYACIL